MESTRYFPSPPCHPHGAAHDARVQPEYGDPLREVRKLQQAPFINRVRAAPLAAVHQRGDDKHGEEAVRGAREVGPPVDARDGRGGLSMPRQQGCLDPLQHLVGVHRNVRREGGAHLGEAKRRHHDRSLRDKGEHANAACKRLVR